MVVLLAAALEPTGERHGMPGTMLEQNAVEGTRLLQGHAGYGRAGCCAGTGLCHRLLLLTLDTHGMVALVGHTGELPLAEWLGIMDLVLGEIDLAAGLLPGIGGTMGTPLERADAYAGLATYWWKCTTLATMWELRLWGIWAHPDQNCPRDTNMDILVRPIPLLIGRQNVPSTCGLYVPIRMQSNCRGASTYTQIHVMLEWCWL